MLCSLWSSPCLRYKLVERSFSQNFQRLLYQPFSSHSQPKKTKWMDQLKKQYKEKQIRQTLIKSICGSALVFATYMYFKDENDLDIKANIDSLKLQEKRCLDAVEGRIPLGKGVSLEEAQKDLKELRQYITEESKKLEGL